MKHLAEVKSKSSPMVRKKPGYWNSIASPGSAASPRKSCFSQYRADLGQPARLLNLFQADGIGCHIITITHDMLQKLSLIGRDLDEYSLDTVKMFHHDALKAGFAL